MSKYTTRIAPSPTGEMHIGTARTAYFNYLAAKASGGVFILRIDDTDINRSNPKYTENILKILEWLGLKHDMIHHQSNAFGYYRTLARKLIEKGLAYNAGDAVLFTEEFVQPKGPVNLVVLKQDGSPSYHFASVVDDMFLGVNYIIRGTDHESNLTKQQFMWNKVAQINPEWSPNFPKVDHVGLIMKDKKKLSKRDNAGSVLWYKDQGYHPEAILNFMLRMGWGPHKDDKSVALINKEKALKLFLEHGNLRKAPSGYDEAKLKSFNRKYWHQEKINACI